MNIEEFIKDLREKLKPSGTLGLVHLHVPSSCSFVEGVIVKKAIDELENKMLLAASGVINKDEITALEKLAIHLLKESV